MKLSSSLFLIAAVAMTTSFSQVTQAQSCGESANKVAIKTYNKAKAVKGTERKDAAKQIKLLQESVNNDPEFYAALWMLTSLQMDHPYVSDITVKEVKDNLHKVVENCPDLHSSPYFVLGEIYKGENNYEKALEYYNKFIDFKIPDAEKYDRLNYKRYRNNAKSGITEVEEKMKKRASLK